MPDLSTPLSSSLPLTRCPSLKPHSPVHSESTHSVNEPDDASSSCNHRLRNPIETVAKRCRSGGASKRAAGNAKSLEEYVREWEEKKIANGVPKSLCFLPFLANSPKMVECLLCRKFLNPGEEVTCSVRGCQGGYHQVCVQKSLGVSNGKKFKCPRHVCFVCKQKHHWRCARCIVASHDKCSPWPDDVLHNHVIGQAVCWRHPTDWRLDKENITPANEIEEVFCRLPLPYFDEEFKTDLTLKDVEDEMESPAYIHIRRNIYLVKKKRDAADVIGCTCSSMCSGDCVCRVQCISCTKVCRCSESCNNRPFRKEKKIKVVKTRHCGWGVEASELINKGEFIIEYVGEVIGEASCEQRLWDMKYRGSKNFYMCEIRKDFIIDATFKGNSSRFLNHSCDPNCFLEKWQVEGETRVGVFAARSIKVGEPLTYDYRFVQFGEGVKCYCGALNCQGILGTKKKMGKVDLCWGLKRKRSIVPMSV